MSSLMMVPCHLSLEGDVLSLSLSLLTPSGSLCLCGAAAVRGFLADFLWVTCPSEGDL